MDGGGDPAQPESTVVAAGSEKAPASPLSMRMSNRTIDEGLDFGHGEGASAGSRTSTAAVAAKRAADDASRDESPPAKQGRCGGGSLSSDSFEQTRMSSFCEGDFQNDDMIDGFGEESTEFQSGSATGRERPALNFDVLGEVGATGRGEEDKDGGANGHEGGGSCSGGGDDQYEEASDSDISDDEIEAMLEAGMRSPRQEGVEEDDDTAHEVKEKVVLKARGHDHFDVLPEGWIQVTHNSGMPVYLHKQSRVCTLSKPYFLGPGSIRKHEVPISAVPCLHYKREKEKEEKCAVTNGVSEGSGDGVPDKLADLAARIPTAKVESVKESQKERSLDAVAFREYCEAVFEFQTVQLRKFKTWAGRRKHKKKLKQMQRPTLPEGTKLITCSLPPTSDTSQITSGHSKREFIMNPSGKSNVCILHEYVQHAMRTQPQYSFKELESSSMPYGATVVISGIEYGTGYGSSKKQAKSEAAKATLEILIPQMKDTNLKSEKSEDFFQDVAFFDEIKVEDPRVNDLCAKTGQLSPYQILLECLKRNYGMGDTEIKQEMKNMKHHRNEFIMSVGKHTASVICRNKKDGKQKASQAILQGLHPHITSWGSLLRLYGKGSCKTLKEKKEEEQRITELQSKASANKPNLSILNKLKEEMTKLKLRREAMKPIGKFTPQDVELPSTSTANLKIVEL
ncbi:hypothetical protein V5799_033518 [Amblyomma americanum]|uniref:DRBM domain-containing protein n=1 Tax=Amblyomma americanum TaxID=6943 RepID=A0AAQ4DN40_AMBAM